MWQSIQRKHKAHNQISTMINNIGEEITMMYLQSICTKLCGENGVQMQTGNAMIPHAFLLEICTYNVILNSYKQRANSRCTALQKLGSIKEYVKKNGCDSITWKSVMAECEKTEKQPRKTIYRAPENC